MKILELHYSTSWAGAERFVVDLCNELAKNNSIIFCTINNDTIPENSYYKNEIKNEIKYINLKCKSGLQIKSLWRILKTIVREKPDIVHAHTDAICLFLPAILYKKSVYFHTLHSLADKCQKSKRLTYIYKWFYKKRIQPITISEICNQSYINLYKLNNAIRINNGRSTITLSNQHHKVAEEIRNKKIHDDDKVFVHVARCDKIKNQDLLIQAFNKIIDNGFHAILIIIGALYDTDDHKYLLEKTHNGIYWVGTKNNVGDYLHYSNFFILSSLWEGLPISLLEAISMGVIPICTPAGGIPNVITSKRIGYLSKDFNEDSFYSTIVEAYNSYSSFDRNYLKEYFINNFSMQACARQYEKTFREYL